MGLKAVSLDIWNTLLDIRPFFGYVALHLSMLSGVSLNSLEEAIVKAYVRMKELRRRGLLSDDNIVNECLVMLSSELGMSSELIKRAVARALLYENLKPLILPGALEAVKKMSDMGLKLATLGNVIFWPGSYTRIILERLGFADHLVFQLYADEIRCSKPKPRAFLELVEGLGVEPDEVIHVGDSFYEDFLGALQAGLRAALIDPKASKTAFRGRAYIISSISDLVELIYEASHTG